MKSFEKLQKIRGENPVFEVCRSVSSQKLSVRGECTNWQICIHLNFLKKLHSMWFVCMGLGIRDDMAFWDIVVGPFELKGPSIKDVRKISGFLDPLNHLSAN